MSNISCHALCYRIDYYPRNSIPRNFQFVIHDDKYWKLRDNSVHAEPLLMITINTGKFPITTSSNHSFCLQHQPTNQPKMISGTIYTFGISPRSSWLPALASYCGHDIKEVKTADEPKFLEMFPIGKAPAFISSSGDDKIIEMISLVQYFAGSSEKSAILGTNIREQVENTKWLSYVNSELLNAVVKKMFGTTDADKEKGAAEITKNLNYINDSIVALKTKYLVNNEINVADMFLYHVIDFMTKIGINLDEFPSITEFVATVKGHPVCA